MFTLNRNTTVISETASVSVKTALSILERDKNSVFVETTKSGGSIVLVKKSMSRCILEPEETNKQKQREYVLAKERYKISVTADKMVIYAQEDSGFISALFYLSEQYLGIPPFWFWMDQKIEQKKKVLVPEGVICSKDPAVLFRGWQLSDKTLFSGWSYHQENLSGWQMCLEALLRCGGNVLIAGNEKMAEEIVPTAEQYGVPVMLPAEKPSFFPELYADAFFCNLQKTNQVTMLPERVSLVNQACNEAILQGKDAFWVVQCSNIRPHIYFLDMLRKKWQGEEVTEASQAESFVAAYFPECESKEEIEALYYEYPEVMMSCEHAEYAGEQFYTENVRLFCHQLLTDRTRPAAGTLLLPEHLELAGQITAFGEICKQKKEELEKLCLACTVTENGIQPKALLSATIGLHIKLHQTCRRAARCFARGYESLQEKDYEKAFLRFGDSAVWFDKGDALLRGAEYGIWKNFYANDCITDIKHTAYMVRKVMGWVRELGDNAAHDGWYQHYCLSGEEQMDAACPVAENHKTDVELYEAMKKRLLR